MIILPICYFPPIPWYAKLASEEEVYLEVWQHYRKQQLTSRTHVLVANRVLPLTIPIRRRGAKVPIMDKKISYEAKWQEQHWRSITNAYKNSPYFEYYEEDLRVSIMQQQEKLVVYLLDQIKLMNSLLGLDTEMILSEEYKKGEDYQMDLRQSFDPGIKNLPHWFSSRPYPQVFGEFHAGLSILDLLFNLGPEAKAFLLNSVEEKKG